MSDPERLLESSAADPEVRELLQSLRDVSPAAGESDRAWNVIAAKVAALPVLATASKSAAQIGSGTQAGTVTAGASSGLALKVVAGALATTLLGAGALVLRAERTARSPETKSVSSATAPVERSVAPAEPPSIGAASSTATVEKPLAPPFPAASAARMSPLELEASMLAKVRSELRSGNSRAAEATLNRLQNTLPKAQMGQEREVLAVEVLAVNGNMAAARRKAHAFIAAHPDSPHNAKLKRLVGER